MDAPGQYELFSLFSVLLLNHYELIKLSSIYVMKNIGMERLSFQINAIEPF